MNCSHSSCNRNQNITSTKIWCTFILIGPLFIHDPSELKKIMQSLVYIKRRNIDRTAQTKPRAEIRRGSPGKWFCSWGVRNLVELPRAPIVVLKYNLVPSPPQFDVEKLEGVRNQYMPSIFFWRSRPFKASRVLAPCITFLYPCLFDLALFF